jgi:hypothetical protein
MSVSFPTLSVGPITVDPSPAYDPSIRSQQEDGKIISRRRFTGNRQKFDLVFDNLTAADKALLITMQNDAGIGADTISWTNEDPNDDTTYIVRLTNEGILFKNKTSDYALYTASFTFVEA